MLFTETFKTDDSNHHEFSIICNVTETFKTDDSNHHEFSIFKSLKWWRNFP